MDISLELRRKLRLSRALIWSTLGVLYFVLALVFGMTPWDRLQVFGMVIIFGFMAGGIVQHVTVRTWNLPAWKRYFYVSVTVVIVSAFLALVELPIENLTKNYSRYIASWQDDFQKTLGTYLFAAAQYFILVIWVHAFFVAYVWTMLRTQELVEKERRLAAAESQAQKAVLSALRAQVNPHFLFNALNAIAALIGSNRNAEAEEALLRLSEFFRASLSAERRQLLSVADELEMLEAYLEMEQIRFPDRLDVSIDMDERATDALMPSFLLQPLVENAIKYAVAPSMGAVHVTISARKDEDALILAVEDDGGEEPPAASAGEGVGLENVRKRIEALYGAAADMQIVKQDPGFRVTIRLPFSDTPTAELIQ